MKNKNNKIAQATMILILLFPLRATAGIPTTDYANLAQGLYENIMSLFNQEELITFFDQYTGHLAEMTGLKIDGNDNAKANAIVRLNTAQQDIQNLEVARADMPSSNACLDFSASINLTEVVKEAWCDTIAGAKEASGASVQSIAFSQEGAGEAAIYDASMEYPQGYLAPEVVASYRHTKNKQIVDRVREQIPNAYDSRRELDPEDVSETPLSAHNILGGDVYSLTDGQYDSAIDFVYLVAPPYESTKRAEGFSNVGTVMALVEASRKNIPNNIMNGIIAERYAPDGGESKLEMMMAYGEDKFSPHTDQDDNFLERITTSKVFSPHALFRDMAVMNVFSNLMAVEAYERSLKREMVKAAYLSQKISDDGR